MANHNNRTSGSLYQPVDTVTIFKFNTDDVREFMQRRISTLIAAAKEAGHDVNDVAVSCISITGYEKYSPIMIIMDDGAIQQPKKKQDKREMMDIFCTDGEAGNNGNSRLKDAIYAAIKPFTYNKDDRKLFLNNASYRQALGLSRSEAQNVANNIAPKFYKIERKREVVMIILDPIRIFSEMVRAEGDKDYTTKNGNIQRPYYIEVEFEKIDSDKAKYTITKKYNKKKSRMDLNEYAKKIVARAMGGDGRRRN